jgi:hypothetical protein
MELLALGPMLLGLALALLVVLVLAAGMLGTAVVGFANAARARLGHRSA